MTHSAPLPAVFTRTAARWQHVDLALLNRRSIDTSCCASHHIFTSCVPPLLVPPRPCLEQRADHHALGALTNCFSDASPMLHRILTSHSHGSFTASHHHCTALQTWCERRAPPTFSRLSTTGPSSQHQSRCSESTPHCLLRSAPLTVTQSHTH
jgi:hypothetical protein